MKKIKYCDHITCGNNSDGDLSIHRGVYQSSEYNIRIRIHSLVNHLRRGVDLPKFQGTKVCKSMSKLLVNSLKCHLQYQRYRENVNTLSIGKEHKKNIKLYLL